MAEDERKATIMNDSIGRDGPGDRDEATMAGVCDDV